jgi:sugar-specific transcriptional regulator TrmB
LTNKYPIDIIKLMKTLLKKLGLSENESLIYVALLENGELTPPEISERISLGRQNTYAILKALEQKELVKKDLRHNKIHYQPESPERLEEIYEEKLAEINKNKELLNNKMPQLLSFYNLAKDRPGISMFSGIEGAQKLYEDTIKRKPGVIKVIYSEKGKNSYLEAWIKRAYTPKRLANQTKIQEIINTKEKNDPEEEKKLLWEKRYINMPKMPKSVDIMIYDDNVTFLNFAKKEPWGFTIDDALVFAAISSLFDLAWDA